jgi:methionyl-tRNA formyltransferase
MTALNILFLGSDDSPLVDFLRGQGERVTTSEERIDTAFIEKNRYDFLISGGYRYIISASMLRHFPKGRAINLHISLLPWNRGAHPNLWSIYDKTPSGVTIHCLEDGIDTGDIMFQRRVILTPGHTLRSSYDYLHGEVQKLFMEHWDEIRSGQCTFTPQPPGGSFHHQKDLEKLSPYMPQGWDTPVSEFIRKL